MMNKFLVGAFLIAPFLLSAQINISQYADSSLFEVKPIILGKGYKEEAETVQAQWLQTLFQPGFDSLDAKNTDGAIDFFSSLADQYPELPEPYYLIGLIEFERFRIKYAKKAFLKAIHRDPLYLPAKFMHGITLVELSEFKEATKAMSELMQFPAYQAQAYYCMGLIKTKQQPSDPKAYKMFEKSIEKDSLFLAAYKQLAMHYFYLERPKKAIATLSIAISLTPEWQEAILLRAIMSSEITGFSDQAEQDLSYLIELDPLNYYYQFMRGFLYIELHKYGEAIEDIRSALKLKEKVTSSRFNYRPIPVDDEELAKLLNYYYSKKTEISQKAQKYLEKGICEIISSKNIYGEWKISTVQLRLAADHTDSPVVDYILATIYDIKGNKEASVKAYTKLIEKDQTFWEIYLKRGDLFRELGEYENAYKDYSTFIESNSQLIEGYEKRGQLSYEWQFYDKAYPDFSFIVSENPNDFSSLFKRAVCANQVGEYELSNKDLNKCLRDNYYEISGGHYVKHLNFLHLGDTLQSLLSLNKAAQIDYQNELVQVELVEMANKLDSIGMVKIAYERLIENGVNPFQWYYERGKWNYHRGNYQQAYFDMKRLVDYNRKNGEVCYYFGRILFEIGREEEAKDWLKRAKKLDYKPIE